ncbi:MAG: hypothetical protein ACK4NA_16425 [Alphaproteobacteria bacterium]
MTDSALVILWIAGLYAGAGLLVAVPFAMTGAPSLVGRAPVTAGARLLLIPGAALLWPFVLKRWLGEPL